MKNFSESMSPKDKTSLIIEFFCYKDDKVWNTKPEFSEDRCGSSIADNGLLRGG